MAYPATGETDTAKRVVPKEEVTQGESTGRVRLVLLSSLALAVLAGILLYAMYFR